jgi:hypothetical protein
LTDSNGVQHTNDSFFNFKLSTDYIDPKMPPTYKVTDPWSTSGAWVFGVQHAFDGLIDHDLLYEELDGFFNAAKNNYGVGPSPAGSEPYQIDFQGGNETNNWYSLRWTLFYNTVRNFVYFGHGGPNGLGYSQSNTNTSVTVTDIGNALHTIPSGQTNRHAFRFVFLDGCSTAKGKMPEAFGIIHKENVSLTDYGNASMRPSCFCGWTEDKWVGNNLGNNVNYDHVNYISHIQESMILFGSTIGAAIDYAASQPDVTSIFTSEFKIYGCRDISFGAFNN